MAYPFVFSVFLSFFSYSTFLSFFHTFTKLQCLFLNVSRGTFFLPINIFYLYLSVNHFLVHIRFLLDVSHGTLYFALNSFFIKMFHVKQSALPIFSLWCFTWNIAIFFPCISHQAQLFSLISIFLCELHRQLNNRGFPLVILSPIYHQSSYYRLLI